MAFIGRFETASTRLARLRTALDSTAQSMGDTVTQSVDLEARRRAMEDSLRQFREVERRLDRTTAPPELPTPQQRQRNFPPSLSPSGRFVDRLEPRRPREPTGFELLFQEAQRQRTEEIERAPQFRGVEQNIPSSPEELAAITAETAARAPVLPAVERFQKRFLDPTAAAGLQAIAQTGPLGGPSLVTPTTVLDPSTQKAIQRQAGKRPELAREGFVNPIAAALGSEEEQEKAQRVLEEAGLPAALAAQILLDPLNVIPIVGFTKVDDFIQVLKLAGKAKGAARARIIENPSFRRTIDAIQSEAGGGPLRGGEEGVQGRLFADDLHIAKADPGPPPPKEPPTGRPSPDDPEFDNILEAALKGEKPEETLIRRHQGAVNTATRIAANETDDVNNLLVKAGLGRRFRQSVVAKDEGSFDELNRLLHNPSKVTSGEMVVPERLRLIYNRLREATDWEQAARVDFDPDMALVEDYFFRGWQPPEGMFTGEARGTLGRNPAFRLPRVNATYDEMIEAGFKPLFENPAEQARYSRLMGVKYREQMKLIDAIKGKELALPHTGGTVPEGWRVPKVGPAFEGKPYAAPNGGVAFTRRWAVLDSLANRLENVYGVTPKLGKGEIFGKTVDFQKVVDAAVFLPKRAKLVGSLFQHVDFLGRSHVGAWTGFIDAMRRGQPVAAVTHLAKWPKSAIDIIHSTFSPGFRGRLSRLAVDDTPLWKGRKISNKMLSEEGLSLRDETIFPELDKVIAEVRAEPGIVQMGKAPLRLLGDLERAWRNGLFKGTYPAATLSDVRNNIGPMLMRQHPNLPDRQLAGMIAKQANTSYSTIPAGMSVVQNQQARFFLTRFLFSINEQEGLLRAFTGAIRGENAAFFRTRLLGTYLGMIALANVIHLASTGKPLPFDRFTPISKDRWGPLPFGYNTNFAAPNIPLTGRSGTQVTLDLMGQMDTAFRTLDPKSFLSARYSVPVRAGVSQVTGKDFFGAPIDTVGPGGIFSRTAQLAQDLFAPIGPGQAGLELLRSNIEEVEGIIQPGEARLGTQGLGVQATGVNLRAETTPQLLDRIRAEVMQEKGIEGSYEDIKATDSPLANEIDNEVEKRIGEELELRRETAELRGQTTPQAQGFEAIEATREVQQAEQLADDAKLNSNQWTGDVWREKFRERQRDFFNRREQIKADFQIEFDDKEAPSSSVNAAIDAYFDVNVDDFTQPDGEVNWDGFFAARDAALGRLSSKDKKRVMKFIRKFDTPTVTQFRKAQEVVDEVFETPKYIGLSLEEGEEVDKILFEIVPRMQTAQLRQGVELERGQAVMAAVSFAKDPDVARFLLTNFGPRLSVRRRQRRGRTVTLEAPDVVNPERDAILIENQDLLALFYPDLLARQLSREQEAALGETAFAAVTR